MQATLPPIVDVDEDRSARWGWSVWPEGDDGLAFDYGAKTVHFGGSLDKSEASQIIDELKAAVYIS